MRKVFRGFQFVLFFLGILSGAGAQTNSPENCLSVEAIWQNALAQQIGVRQDQFQLYQGAGALPLSNQELWNIFNAIPPASSNHLYNPSQYNNFAQVYGWILYAMTVHPNDEFHSCMGDYFIPWKNYLAENKPEKMNSETLSKLFSEWSEKKAPERAGCVTALTNLLVDPLNSAILSYDSAAGRYAWDKTLENLESDLAAGASLSFKLDSLITLKIICDSLLDDSMSAPQYDTLRIHIQMQANFDKFDVFYANPLSVVDSINPVIQEYIPWFSPQVFARAYNTPGPSVWGPDELIDWNSAFGSYGFMQRLCVGLVAVKGIETKISYHYHSGSTDQLDECVVRLLKDQAQTIFCTSPFFQESQTSIKQEADHSVVYTISSSSDQAYLLGVIVSNMEEYVQNIQNRNISHTLLN